MVCVLTNKFAFVVVFFERGTYSCLRTSLILRREYSYYLLQLYIPSFMLVIVSWVSFWLDKDAVPARVSLSITTLLTMTTQASGINAKLPPVSYTKAIDVWIGVCLAFIFGALLEYAFVNYAGRLEFMAKEKKKSQNKLIPNPPAPASKVAPDPTISRKPGATIASGAALFTPKATSMLTPGQPVNHTTDTLVPISAQGGHVGQTVQGGPNFNVISHGEVNIASGIGNFPPSFHGQTMQNSSTVVIPQRFQEQHMSCPQCDLEQQSHLEQHSSPYKPLMGIPTIQAQMNSRHFRTHKRQRFTMPHFNCKIFRNLMNKFPPERSKRIDVISRMFFPSTFFLFNVVYWTIYIT